MGREYYNCLLHRTHIGLSRSMGLDGIGCSLTREECKRRGGPNYCSQYLDEQMRMGRKL